MTMKVKLFDKYHSPTEMWNDFIHKINTGIIAKDVPDVKNIDKIHSIAPYGKVLDISVGDGSQSEYLIQKGYDVYGTDISDLAIETIKEKLPKQHWYVHDTQQRFKFDNNVFDIVFARFALHYFTKDSIQNILKDIYRIMKPNGILFIMVKAASTDDIGTGKKSYTTEEWLEMVGQEFSILENNTEVRKAYSFEKQESNILEIFAKRTLSNKNMVVEGNVRDILPRMVSLSNNSQITMMTANNIVEKFDEKELNDFKRWLQLVEQNSRIKKNKYY